MIITRLTDAATAWLVPLRTRRRIVFRGGRLVAGALPVGTVTGANLSISVASRIVDLPVHRSDEEQADRDHHEEQDRRERRAHGVVTPRELLEDDGVHRLGCVAGPSVG